MQTSRRSFLGMLAAALPIGWTKSSPPIPAPVAAVQNYYTIEWPVRTRQREFGTCLADEHLVALNQLFLQEERIIHMEGLPDAS